MRTARGPFPDLSPDQPVVGQAASEPPAASPTEWIDEKIHRDQGDERDGPSDSCQIKKEPSAAHPALCLTFPSVGKIRSGLAAEGHVVVDIEQVEPTTDVVTVWGDLLLGLVHVFAALNRGGNAGFLPCGPGLDLKLVGLGRGVGGDPLEDLTISLAGLELLQERLGIDAGKFDEVLIKRAVVVILAVGSGDGRTALVEHAGKDDIAAEADAGTAGRTLGEIHGIKMVALHHDSGFLKRLGG
jgi:hypothetical protein